MADAVLSLLRRIMHWYASRSDDFTSPIVKGMARTNPNENARERILTDDEIRAVWLATDEARPFDALVKFLLLTGCRVAEATHMIRAELVGDSWVLPAARNKVKVDLERPLSGAARAVLDQLPNLGDYIFTSDGKCGLGGISRRKSQFDDRCGVKDWVIHDLRRTARSLMSRAGVSPDHSERCLGHKLKGVRGVYDRHEYIPEMAIAYEKLASLIERIVHPVDNITVMPARG
jgi:integrase